MITAKKLEVRKVFLGGAGGGLTLKCGQTGSPLFKILPFTPPPEDWVKCISGGRGKKQRCTQLGALTQELTIPPQKNPT